MFCRICEGQCNGINVQRDISDTMDMKGSAFYFTVALRILGKIKEEKVVLSKCFLSTVVCGEYHT
jgi:hypothetical protein